MLRKDHIGIDARRGRRSVVRAALAAMLALMLMTAAATAHTPRRDHHRIIRMHIQSTGQLGRVLALGAEPLNCVIAPGEQHFSASPAVLQDLQRMGLRFDVLHENAQALIDRDVARMRAQAGAPQNDGGIAGGGEPSWFADFKTYAQVNAYMNDLATLRPDLASTVVAGTSLEGRSINAIRITAPAERDGGAQKPVVLINGCQHAREWIAVMVPMYVAHALVHGYGEDPRITALLERVEFIIVPIVNPDGYEYTYAKGGDRFWRKNRRDNGNGTWGVDLNRNWSIDWGGPHNTSTNPNDDTYIGVAAFSEPETATLRDFLLTQPRLVAHIDFHSFGQLLMQSWMHTNLDNADTDLFNAIGTAMNDEITAVHGEYHQNGIGGWLLYEVSGAFADWCYGVRNMLSYTVELRDRGLGGFDLPPHLILPTCEEHLPGVLTLAERATAGAEFFFPNGLPLTLEANVATPIVVHIRPTPESQLNSETGRLWWRVGATGTFNASPLVMTGAGQYVATLPALACGQRVQYYLEILNSGGAAFRWPQDAPRSVASATAARVAHAMSNRAGWSTAATTIAGFWQHGVPVNDPNYPYDPRTDGDGDGVCWLTENAAGYTPVIGASVVLTSPVIDVPAALQPGERASIEYAYFLHTVSPLAGDSLLVELSTNGEAGPFTQVALHQTNGGALWRRQTITAADLASLDIALSNNTVLRFSAADNEPQSIIEAAVDAVRIFGDCAIGSCPGDIEHGGAVNVDDLLAVIQSWGSCAPPCAADVAPPGGNGRVDVDDLLAVFANWGPCPQH